MSNETMVTVQGWVGSVPMLRETGGVAVLNFRFACTPRYFNRTTQEWADGATQWYTVSAWRRLAEHAGRSLHQGDPVVIHGRLIHRTYVNKNNVEVLALDIEAVTIGHDLSRGTAAFAKAPSTDPQAAGQWIRQPSPQPSPQPVQQATQPAGEHAVEQPNDPWAQGPDVVEEPADPERDREVAAA